MTTSLNIIILAAGQGKRMRSQLPKVLHTIGGLSMLERVVKTAQSLRPKNIFVVYGHDGEKIRAQCAHLNVTWVEQTQQLGTGHAVQQVLPFLKDPHEKALILYADAPLLSKQTLTELIEHTPDNTLGILTTNHPQPTGLGRIIRNNKQQITHIVEEKDTTIEQRSIKEINSGVYVCSVQHLIQWLPQIKNTNQQKEFYLTDIIAYAVNDAVEIKSIKAVHWQEVQGINDRIQLAMLERYYQLQLAQQYMSFGVTLLDPARFDVRGNADISEDVTIDVNVILEGQIMIGQNSRIGANCILRNVQIGENVEIKANCVIEDTVIGNQCAIGPFARIRPGTVLKEKVSVGNFVEIKKSDIGAGSKIPHLSYVGDAVFGEKVNFGAGAITCNYDGISKNQTIIGNNVFIGSDSQLIAPVVIEDGAYIGAGSTISENAPANKLTLSRAKQQTIENWQRPVKDEKGE